MQQTGLTQRYFDMLLASQFWPEAQLRAFQRDRLSQLLRHARAQVPFYARRLDPVFDGAGEIVWERWRELPIVRRADLAGAGPDMLALRMPTSLGAVTKITTSGSTGVPITVFSSELAHTALRANRYRAYHWHHIDCSRPMTAIFGDDPDVAAWPAGKDEGAWGPPWEAASAGGAVTLVNRLTDYAKILELMARTGAAYLATGPKTGLAVALEAERLGMQLRLDAFLPQGAMIGDVERDAMQRAFGARTLEFYSSKEGAHMAYGCPEQPGLHVNAESVLVEILDAAGEPCPIGQPGRVIITPLLNWAQPLIRYEQGDVGTWMEPCPCGRHLPRLGALIGRAGALFHHPDGRARSALLLPNDKKVLNCLEWQVTQTGPTEFEFLYVPVDPAISGDEAAMAAIVRRVYFSDANIRFVRVDSIAAGPGGKPVEYLSAWRPGGAI